MSDNPRGDRRPPRREGDRGRRSDSAGPKQPPRSGGKPTRAGKPHPSMTPRPRRGESAEPDTKSVRPRLEDPFIPDEVTPNDLSRDVRNELKTLTAENQEYVARHLAMAARLIDEEPGVAHLHALSASRRGGRIGVVRETLAITAYRTGDYALALRELRTYRRITGKDDQLPLMVDSERGLGRPERALELARSVPRGTLPVPVQVELAIAMSGARLDLGQAELALAELEIPQLDPDVAFSWSPALFGAYATVLEELGRGDEAAVWLRRADVALEALGDSDGDDADLIEVFEDETSDAADGDETGPDAP
ncbi:MAG TPA: hypothetical protein VNR37_07195 [Microbacteriaceae bacterium]|nr:hypothetical protein [Microbacteriaceae bacterium]